MMLVSFEKQCIKSLSVQCIMDGDVQAYTATNNKEGNGDTLPLSLHAKLMVSPTDHSFSNL